MIKPLTNLPNYGTKTDEITIYAGPCSVESEEQFFEVAECIADLGLSWIRGGAFKPRTNPHSFQGLGEEGLKIMKAGGDKYGLKTLTEVMDSAHTELVHSYVDGLQVGARNMQNFSLLKKIGEVTKDSHKMVLLKRGLAGTISEWLSATEYITMNGNETWCSANAVSARSRPPHASRSISRRCRSSTSSRSSRSASMFRIPQACATSCHRFPMLQWRQAPTRIMIEAHPNPPRPSPTVLSSSRRLNSANWSSSCARSLQSSARRSCKGSGASDGRKPAGCALFVKTLPELYLPLTKALPSTRYPFDSRALTLQPTDAKGSPA